jgi:hypothetical protein
MTVEELQAKREWGTGACQAKGCTTRAAFLVMEGADWWQYCCPKHAKHYGDEHGLDVPARAPSPPRRVLTQ